MSAVPAAGFTLANARWPEVDAGPRLLLVVPLGSLEQHGPHLPMDTDTRIACAVASRACRGRAGVGLAPPVAIGASGEHADFPGTLSIGTTALASLLVELGRHASLHWPATLLVNGHGGNVPAITSAVRQLRDEGRQCHVWHAGLPGGDGDGGDSGDGGGDSGDGDSGGGGDGGAHAGRTETSVMLALAPDDVLPDRAAAGETKPLAEIMPSLRAHGVRKVSPNGVLGDPSGASAAEGARLLGLLVASLNEKLDSLLTDPARARSEGSR
jgi:mycofactocin precursor peptide peptidase